MFIRLIMVIRLLRVDIIISRSHCPSKTLSDSILSLQASKLGFVKLHLNEGAIHCHWALKVKAL